MRIKLNDEVFFGEEVTVIHSSNAMHHNEKVLTEIFLTDEGKFAIKKSFADRGNLEPSYDFIDLESLNVINSYLKKQEELDNF